MYYIKSYSFIVILFVLLSYTSCYRPGEYEDYEFNPGKNKEFLALRTNNKGDSVAADGKTTIVLVASIDNKTSDSLQNIEFKTTKGVFEENGSKTFIARAKEIDPNNGNRIIAKATLQPSVFMETAIITARVKNIEQLDTLKFYKVYPTKISLQPSGFSITQAFTSESVITANLGKETGTPTVGQLVNFLVINEKKDTIINTEIRKGNFRSLQNRSDEKGNTSFAFTLGDTTYLGSLKIFANTNVPDGTTTKSIKDSIQIYVIK